MGLITTQVLGFGDPKPPVDPKENAAKKADPKPVRGINYAGLPMRDGDYYDGRPEHMRPPSQLEQARAAITPKEQRTPQQVSAMQARMARARAALAEKRAKLKSKFARQPSNAKA
jgi:hypothetical protein